MAESELVVKSLPRPKLGDIRLQYGKFVAYEPSRGIAARLDAASGASAAWLARATAIARGELDLVAIGGPFLGL